MAGTPVTGDLYYEIDGKLMEIKRQLRQKKGYPFNPYYLRLLLQSVIEGTILPLGWKTFRFLTVGYGPVGWILNELEGAGRQVTSEAKDFMWSDAFETSHDAFPPLPTFTLVRVKVGDLGFTERPTTLELFERERLIRLGLDLCPTEVGPNIAIHYDDQPEDDSLWVAMEPSITPDGHPHVFFLSNSERDGLWLRLEYIKPERLWGLEEELIFSRYRS